MPPLSPPTADRIEAAVDRWRAGLPDATRRLLKAILAGSIGCHVLGRNCHGEFIAKHLPLAGFVDDDAATGETWLGLPVVRGDALPAGGAVVNAVLHRRPQRALQRLRSLAGAPVAVSYADFTRLDSKRFPPLPFVSQCRSVFGAHAAEFTRLALRLDDDASRRAYADLLQYRLTGDPAFTAAYRLRDAEQYFDVPLGLPTAPVFVDGGAYRGETSELFARHYPDYGGIHVFEPNPESMRAARVRLGDFRNIRYHSCALGEAPARLAFDASAANASRIAEGGAASVAVVALDDAIDGAVDFVKFDLEGYEPRALAGSRRTIEAHHPALAVCVYHHAKDFIDVPAAVLAIRDDYRVRLRHYTEGWEETVMYFTPPQAA